jgi:hypothetical protein
MANALVCNLCQREGKAAFATVHAEGKVGLGKRARAFDVDLCEQHAEAFAPLLSVSGPPPAQTNSKPTDRMILQTLARFDAPVSGPEWFAAIKPAVLKGVWVRVHRAFRAQRLIQMTGQKANARYAITPAGRRVLTDAALAAAKEKAPGATAPSAPGEPQRAARKPPRLRRGPRQAGRRR